MRELISDIVLELDYIKTLKLVVDRLTKPLTLVKLEYFVTILRLAKKIGDIKLASPPPPLPTT